MFKVSEGTSEWISVNTPESVVRSTIHSIGSLAGESDGNVKV